MWIFFGPFDEKYYSGHRQLFSTFPKMFLKQKKNIFKFFKKKFEKFYKMFPYRQAKLLLNVKLQHDTLDSFPRIFGKNIFNKCFAQDEYATNPKKIAGFEVSS